MKVVLVNFINKRFYDNLGIKCINAYLRENGIDSEILNMFIDDDEVSDAQKEKIMGYDIYGFSIYHNVVDCA